MAITDREEETMIIVVGVMDKQKEVDDRPLMESHRSSDNLDMESLVDCNNTNTTERTFCKQQ
jgi:hypothetical protein